MIVERGRGYVVRLKSIWLMGCLVSGVNANEDVFAYGTRFPASPVDSRIHPSRLSIALCA